MLTLFAVMLTHRIADVQVSNRSVGRVPAAILVGGRVLVVAWCGRRCGATWVA